MARCLLLFASFILFNSLVSAGHVSYDWSIGWVTANPDGELARPVIGVNGAFPNPAITANVGDTVSVNVHNNLGNQTTSIHFHGLHQTGNNAMDGPPGAVQCPIPPGASFTYTFTIDQPGTYWWHSHSPAQYMDGLRGPLIVHDPQSPYRGQYSGELVITVADWYHGQMPQLVEYYLSPEENTDGSEPVPYSALMSEGQNTRYPVQAGQTYLVRLINMAGFSQAYFAIDQHNMTIVEVDGVYTHPYEVDMLYIATAQRYSMLVQMHQSNQENYAILASLDTNAFDNVPSYLNPNVTGYLEYNPKKNSTAELKLSQWSDFDDMSLVPYDNMPALPAPNHQVVLNLSFFEQDNQNRAGWNNVTYIPQVVPTLYTVQSAGPHANNPAIYGANVNPIVLKYNDVVEVIINNFDNGPHPIHIHGHAPQIISRSPGAYVGDVPTTGNSNNAPLRRDTWTLAPLGSTVIRFVANNPGVWVFHCHMDWHVVAGLTATFIEAPFMIQQQAQSPQMLQICKQQGIPTVGNAGGNAKNWTDLSNAPTTCPGAPWGSEV